jgi:hypothetical protein
MVDGTSSRKRFLAIDSSERALKVIKVWSRSLLLLALARAALGVLLLNDYATLIHAGLMAGCALAVWRLHSRVAAALLVLLAVAEIGVSIVLSMEGQANGGSGMGPLVLWAAGRAFQATIALHDLTEVHGSGFASATAKGK